MHSKLWIESIVRVVNEIGGYFTFESGGDEFVVMRKNDFEKKKRASAKQLGLGDITAPETEEISEDSLNIESNRLTDLSTIDNSSDYSGSDYVGGGAPADQVEYELGAESRQPASLPIDHDRIDLGEDKISGADFEKLDPPTGEKVRFEPLKGDLPPDLQE